MFCIFQSSQCQHTSFIAENTNTSNIDLPESTSKKVLFCSWIQGLFSWKGILFYLDDVELKHQYSRPLLERILSGLLAEPRVGDFRLYGNIWSDGLSLISGDLTTEPFQS